MGIWMKGKETADQLAGEISRQVEAWKAQGIRPLMATMLVKGDPASAYYAQAKRKVAERLGISFELREFEPEVEAEVLLQQIGEWNTDPTVHGIMVELPLPPQVDAARITAAIDPGKDVDGVTPANKLAVQTGAVGLYPATPQACIRLLKQYGYQLAGKHAVVIGRGETVGKPLVQLLLRENATVTVCHSRTTDLARHIRQADVVFTAAGSRGLVKPDMVHPKLIIIDAGINETEEGRIAGDTLPETIDYVEAMSPVPGGVGTVTTMMLFHNLMEGMSRRLEPKPSIQRPYEQSVGAFLKAAASSEPTPGGGGVAAIACALGASMGAMTAKLTTGPKFAADTEQAMNESAQRLDGIIRDCERIAADDARSFQAFMEALKLPKATEEDKAKRKQALEHAAIQATNTPMELIRLCSVAVEVMGRMAEAANRNVISDLGIGVLLAEAAAQSGGLTVRINLPSIQDDEKRQVFIRAAETMLNNLQTQKENTLAIVHRRL
nr:cyclodeaminase/cyclohydrolase family protein [Paenibacillus cremeus]